MEPDLFTVVNIFVVSIFVAHAVASVFYNIQGLYHLSITLNRTDVTKCRITIKFRNPTDVFNSLFDIVFSKNTLL